LGCAVFVFLEGKEKRFTTEVAEDGAQSSRRDGSGDYGKG
jgi:hypothetical protein